MRIAGKLHMCERINNSCLIHQHTSLDLQINPNSYVKVLYDLTFQKKKHYMIHSGNISTVSKYAAVAIFPHNFEIVTVQRKTGKSGNNLSSQWHKGSPLTWI